MKTIVTPFVFMCALTLFGMPALGQITITSSDVSAQLAVGDSLAYKIDKQTSSFNIGVLGSNSWDFSSLHSDSSQTLKSVAVSGTPFTGQFPGATHVFQTDIAFSYPSLSPTPIPVTAYIYFQLSTNNLLNLGEGANGTGPTWTGASAQMTNKPADVFYKLPLTFGTAWLSTFVDTTTIFLGTFPLPQPGVRHNVAYVVDAYGPMTIPGGSVHDALRIRKTDTISTGIRLSFIFLAGDGASVQVTATDPSQPVSGIIAIFPNANWNKEMVRSPLPVQLTSFNALQNPSGAGVILRWSTLSEVNNYGFEVQRGARSGGCYRLDSLRSVRADGRLALPDRGRACP